LKIALAALICAVFVGILVCPDVRADDNIGRSWDGVTKWNSYISMYGKYPAITGQAYPMVVLDLWDSYTPFSDDSTAADSTNQLNVSRYLADGNVVWTTVNDSVANLDAFALYVQAKDCRACDWYTVQTLVNQDSITEQTNIDTLLLGTNPYMRHPYLRFYIEGPDSEGSKYTEITLHLTLFRTEE